MCPQQRKAAMLIDPMPEPGSPLPALSVLDMAEEVHVSETPALVSVSVSEPAAAVMAPPGRTVQVFAVAAARAAGPPRAATRTAAPPATRTRAYRLLIAVSLASGTRPHPASATSLVPERERVKRRKAVSHRALESVSEQSPSTQDPCGIYPAGHQVHR